MTDKKYYHPAIGDLTADEKITGIVISIIQKSNFLQIIALNSKNTQEIIFVPRRIYSLDIEIGECFYIVGEQRQKDYYGDILIANELARKKPNIDLFYFYSKYNFPFLSEIILRKIINEDPLNFINAVLKNDGSYFVKKIGITPFMSGKFIYFSKSNLAEAERDDIDAPIS